VTLVLTPEQFGLVVEQLPAELELKIVAGLRSAAQRGKVEVVHQIDTAEPHPARNFGELRNSVKVSRLRDGALLSVDAPHAPFMEHGIRPTWVPLAPLIVWATRKFKSSFLAAAPKVTKGMSRYAKMVARSERQRAVSEETMTDVARNVQRAIARRGIAPRHYFAKAAASLPKFVHEEIKHELEKWKAHH
jgi:hypothetical protein